MFLAAFIKLILLLLSLIEAKKVSGFSRLTSAFKLLLKCSQEIKLAFNLHMIR